MRRLSMLTAVLVAIGCASSDAPKAAPAATFEKSTGYSAQPGKEAVGVVPAATIHDAQRNRDVELSIEYPIKGGPYPLIIFSHDYGASEQSYEQLVSYWTSNGYAVIRPRHADAGKGPDAMRAIFGEQTNEEARNPTRNQQPDDAPACRENQAFQKKLPDQTCPAFFLRVCAECGNLDAEAPAQNAP